MNMPNAMVIRQMQRGLRFLIGDVLRRKSNRLRFMEYVVMLCPDFDDLVLSGLLISMRTA